MKAHIKENYEISESVLLTTVEAINLFLESDIECDSKQQQLHNRKLAETVKEKLINQKSDFDAEEMRIIYVCLENMRLTILKVDFDSAEDKKMKDVQLKNISSFQGFLNRKFTEHGLI